MRRLTLLIGLTLLLPTSVLAHGTSHHHRNHYTICTLRKDHSEPKRCWRVPMPRHWKVPTDHHKNCSWSGVHWVCVTWPTFKPKSLNSQLITRGYWITVNATGYDDHSQPDANGPWPGHGYCAAHPGVLPYGTTFYAPGYGQCTIEDTGGGLSDVPYPWVDFWFSSPGECDAWTGLHRVFVYR